MSKASASYQEIGQDKWNPVMATITRIYRGSHGKLEILGTDVSYQVETEDKPFEGIAADIKDGERIVWMHFGDLAHAVHRASVVRMVPQIGEAGPVIEVEDEDGTKTILTLGLPVEYALPPGEEERSQRK
jgi:hypothetical protein